MKRVHKQDDNHIRRGSLRKERNIVISGAAKATDIQKQYEHNFNIALNRWLAESVLHEYEDGAQGAEDIRYKLLTSKETNNKGTNNG